jgi:transposase, IS5 family
MARRIHAQYRHRKSKVYSVYEPEVACIAKGKAGKSDCLIGASA